MEVTLFNDDWYHKIIQQTQRGFSEDTSADAAAIAVAIMTAGCCISQALDHLSKKADKINDSLEAISDTIREVS